MKNVKNRFLNMDIDPLFCVMLLLMYITGHLSKFLCILISILLHESGHIITAVLTGAKIYSIKLLPIGLHALINDDSCNRTQRLIIYSSGPIINALSGIFCLLVNYYYRLNTGSIYFFSLSNICLAIFNMIPVLPLDGGKILREFLMVHIGFFSTARHMKKISFFLSALLVLLGVFQLINNFFNFSLIIAGVYIFFTIITIEFKEAVFVAIKDIIFRCSRFFKKGIYPARELVVLKTVHLNEILKYLDYDRIHIVYVLDEKMKIIDAFTEKEIIDAIINLDAGCTFEEFVRQNQNE